MVAKFEGTHRAGRPKRGDKREPKLTDAQRRELQIVTERLGSLVPAIHSEGKTDDLRRAIGRLPYSTLRELSYILTLPQST